MSIIEFVGFIISMVFMGIMYLRRMKAERYRQEHPEEFPEDEYEHDEEIEAYLQSQHSPRRRTTLPHPTMEVRKSPTQELKRSQVAAEPPKKELFQTSMKKYREQSDAEQEGYEVKRLKQNKRTQNLLSQLRSPQDLILLKEILGPPKALQKSSTDPMAMFDEHS